MRVGPAAGAVALTGRLVQSVQRLAGNRAAVEMLGSPPVVQREPAPGAEPAPPTVDGPGSKPPEESSREPTKQERDEWGSWFDGAEFRMIRPPENGYNCFSWALGFTDRFITNDTLLQARLTADLDGWTRYLADNHRLTPTKDGLDPAADLILYGNSTTAIGHAARKAVAPVDKMTFSSKLGDGRTPVILHAPEAIQGRSYGAAQRSFRRL